MLATIDLGVATGNVAIGENGGALYVTAGPSVWRLPLVGQTLAAR